jgi:short subunit fatty acids transporter
MGGFDTLVNHDLIAHLSDRPSARTEVGLHALREALYAALFIGLGWFAWHGAAATIVAGLLVAEVLVSTADEYVENRTRVLPQNERVLHVFLTLNLGFILVMTVLVLGQWIPQTTELVPRAPSPLTWVLSALAAAALFWAGRDLASWIRLHVKVDSRSKG